MKKLLAIGLMCFLVGCSESPRNDEGNYVAERTKVPTNGKWEIHWKNQVRWFRYIEVDGHQYLLMTGAHASGLTHSPKCPCLKNKVEIVLPLNDAITNEMTRVVPL